MLPSRVLVVDFYPLPFVAGGEEFVHNVAHLRYCVLNEEKDAFHANQIRHHDVFPATKSFVGVSMKFGANLVVQEA